MNKYITIAIAVTALLLAAGCDDQRDLYVMSTPMLVIDGDWEPSLGKSDMRMDATAISYTSSGVLATEFFYSTAPNRTSIELGRGINDVMIFNGLYYSDEETHLDGIHFRGTDRFDTFEAVVEETTPNRRLARADGEYIASNKMELFAAAVIQPNVDGQRAYYPKYKNGENGYETPPSYIEDEVTLEPLAMNYECHVLATFDNISSAWSAAAALRGFVGSAYVGSGRPSQMKATHHFNLNSKKMLNNGHKDRGTLEYPNSGAQNEKDRWFVTFGPQIDADISTWRYEVFMNVMLSNGEWIERTFDVTDQIVPYIEQIKNNIAGVGPRQHRIKIDIVIPEVICLPDVGPSDGSIGVGDWEDDEIITVPIPKPKGS